MEEFANKVVETVKKSRTLNDDEARNLAKNAAELAEYVHKHLTADKDVMRISVTAEQAASVIKTNKMKILRMLNNGSSYNPAVVDIMLSPGPIKPSKIITAHTTNTTNSDIAAIQNTIKEHESAEKPQLKRTTMVECRKCHAMDASYYSKQMKSSDEPETVFYTCNNCGEHWRIG